MTEIHVRNVELAALRDNIQSNEAKVQTCHILNEVTFSKPLFTQQDDTAEFMAILIAVG
jgi:hypothetical protein